MERPLALPGEGLHFARVRAFPPILLFLLATPAAAQVELVPDVPPQTVPSQTIPPETIPPETTPETPQGDTPPNDDGARIIIEPPVELLPAPDLPPDVADPPDASGADETVSTSPTPDAAPDYSRLSAAEERAARLDAMFVRLSEAESETAGNLVAEEIWAVWLNSGSPSSDLILRRGAAAQGLGDTATARLMFDHVTALQPDYAEGWARSSRLALEERDFARAVSEAMRALTLEPRHFYAMQTLGNVLERLGRQEEALDAYREAARLHPTLGSVGERIDALEVQLDGSIL
ncbi:tetratricopeptide repeat protein [uncultured Algimonas sp.]|uniref:tetratricopeptide repeat protein n=1 Tax=uncultured Algimonas sp. TaxID=1547920 RepID=UPI002603275B|nr:tetratricopeptide repeat protein [uncultured Algimonas sp.]